MKQHNVIEKEQTPKSDKLSSNSTLVIPSCRGKVLNVTSFKALCIFKMRSIVPISESCEFEMSLDYSRPLVNDNYR